MYFLITGGTGFIGATLANRLARDGHQVRVLDNLSNSERSTLDPAVHFHRGDVNDVPLLWTMLQDVDCVYHLAARVSVAQSILYPGDYNSVNVGGTVSLMEAMRDAGVGRVIFASSGAIYGQQPRQPVPESASPFPDSPYAVSKWAAEQYVATIGALWGIETVALRIFNAYGPGQSMPVSHAPVVPRFLRQALSGGSVVIFGNGEQTRDFIYITDVVEALVQAAKLDSNGHRVINVGSGRETSVEVLSEAVEMVTGRRLKRIYNREKSGGVKRLVADITRAEAWLSWSPTISLAEGLARTLREDERYRLFESSASPIA